MVRRVMEGNRKFGMATLTSQDELFDVACEVGAGLPPPGTLRGEDRGMTRVCPLAPLPVRIGSARSWSACPSRTAASTWRSSPSAASGKSAALAAMSAHPKPAPAEHLPASRLLFRISSCKDQDGYRVARVEPYEDRELSQGETEEAKTLAGVSAGRSLGGEGRGLPDACRTPQEVNDLLEAFVESLRRATPASRHGRLAEWLGEAGDRPQPENFEAFGYYVAQLTAPDSRSRSRILASQCPLTRLREAKRFLEGGRLQPAECCLM